MYSITPERLTDADAIEILLDQAFGPAWRLKPSTAFRAGTEPLPGLNLVARANAGLVGTIRTNRACIGAD
jgi:predicted N-acetyltransferase YhbS